MTTPASVFVFTKPWWKSRGVIGGIVAIIAGLVSAFQVHLGADLQGGLVDAIVGGLGSVGGALAIYGRVMATKKIS